MDPATAVATWKTTYYQPFSLGLHQFWPLPRHLLGTAFGGDKAAFRNLPYWTSGYVNTGPFRLVDYGLGEEVVFERFDDYFLGAPKVDKIVIHVVGDANAMLANLQSGAVDMASYGGITSSVAATLDTEWKRTGAGTVVNAPGNLRYWNIQFDPQWASPPELSRDARIRQGLLMAVDREALREAILPGVLGTDADSILPDEDPRNAALGKPFARYAYNPTAGLRILESAGWRRASDGRLLNQAGVQATISVRAQPSAVQERAIFAQHWRDLGIQVDEVAIPPNRLSDREYLATFPGLYTSRNDKREGFFVKVISTEHATAQNRWGGNNVGHYANPRVDQLFGLLTSTPDPKSQLPILKELLEILGTELPVLPSYYGVTQAAVRKAYAPSLTILRE